MTILWFIVGAVLGTIIGVGGLYLYFIFTYMNSR